MTTDEARARLGEYVRRRRRYLRLTIDEAAALGQMSPTTWSRVETAKAVRDLTYGGIDKPLQWEAGSADNVLAGGDPVPIAPPLSEEEKSPVELQRELMERIKRINADPQRADMLDKFTQSIDPGAEAS